MYVGREQNDNVMFQTDFVGYGFLFCNKSTVLFIKKVSYFLTAIFFIRYLYKKNIHN